MEVIAATAAVPRDRLVTVDGEADTVPTGRALVFPTGEPHALHGEGAFKMLLTMVAGQD